MAKSEVHTATFIKDPDQRVPSGAILSRSTKFGDGLGQIWFIIIDNMFASVVSGTKMTTVFDIIFDIKPTNSVQFRCQKYQIDIV